MEGIDSLAVDLLQRSRELVIFETSFVIFLSIISLIGNIMVCFVVLRNSRLQTIPNMFVVALAISDIAVAVLAMPLSAVILMQGKWPYDKDYKFCLFMGFCLFQCGCSSLQMMCQIAVNR